MRESEKTDGIYPEIQDRIRRDISEGFRVLGIPETPVETVLHDQPKWSVKDYMFGELMPGCDRFDIYLCGHTAESEEDRANLSYVVWSTLRWWFRRYSLERWQKEKILCPNVTEDDIAGWMEFMSVFEWYSGNEKVRGKKYGEQFSMYDMSAFAVMMLDRYYPEYTDMYIGFKPGCRDRYEELKARYAAESDNGTGTAAG